MENTRTCKVCKLPKDISAFPRNSSNKDAYYRHECLPCYSTIKKQEKINKKKWFQNFKSKLSCARCRHPDERVLEFHHDDPAVKEISVGDAVAKNWSSQRIEEEINKCTVLCVNCHRKHHVLSRQQPVKNQKLKDEQPTHTNDHSIEIRKCRACLLPKPAAMFQSAGIVNGKQYFRHICTQCKTSKQKDRKNVIREWLEGYKTNLSCATCKNDDSDLLDFHHADPTTKEITVSDAVQRGWSISKIKAEIEKCKILCGNCHRIHHHEERVEAKKILSKAPCAVEKHPI